MARMKRVYVVTYRNNFGDVTIDSAYVNKRNANKRAKELEDNLYKIWIEEVKVKG